MFCANRQHKTCFVFLHFPLYYFVVPEYSDWPTVSFPKPIFKLLRTGSDTPGSWFCSAQAFDCFCICVSAAVCCCCESRLCLASLALWWCKVGEWQTRPVASAPDQPDTDPDTQRFCSFGPWICPGLRGSCRWNKQTNKQTDKLLSESVQEEFTNNAFQSVADRVYVHELSALF